MDVKRIDSVAVPTAIAGVAAGATGFITARAIDKEGQMTDRFVKHIVNAMDKADNKLLKTADSLDKINALVGEEEMAAFNGDGEALLAHVKKKMAKADKALEKFVRKHAEALDIQPKEKQSLKEAVKEFLQDKNAQKVKELFLPGYMRKALETADNEKLVKEMFAESFDSATKKFKKDEALKDTVNFFKKHAMDMKLKQAGLFAGIAGSIALVSSAMASRIVSK